MNRNLLPATIIPADLYVERAADRQLHEVIRGMGRPGYVLVARQMGKTNLLLNARRQLEEPDLLFVYVDLSNRVDTLEAYFGLVLNTAFSVHPQLLTASQVKGAVKSQFTSFEFESLLRKVLSNFRGRLVIVLDEIDSLANYPFSDRIFSQIRSMYFSRSNFSEYARITYVLSGVAEPNDLIRDKNVSPFNIGEKIYLNDFTRDEFALFLKKAGLLLPSPIEDRIYYWTHGNPRITWDVCSEIESAVIAGVSPIGVEAVDEIVSGLYFASYDRPPVDHIRTLAQADRDIRQGVVAIRTNRSSEISDRVRNKLYLAGITNVELPTKSGINLSIKNPIISEALSPKWLGDLEKDAQQLLAQARNSIEEKLYEPAVAYYEQYLTEHAIDVGRDAYRLSAAYFNTRKYSKAIEWLTTYLNSEQKEDEEVRIGAHLLLGRALTVQGNFQDAADHLKKATASTSKPTASLARALLGSVYLQLDKDEHTDEVSALSQRALQDISEGDDENRANTRIIALTNLAAIEEQRGNRSEAIQLLDTASQQYSVSYKPLLLLKQIKLLPAGERKEALLNDLADSVIAIGSKPAEERMDSALRQVALPAMMYLGLNRREKDFARLLSYVTDSGEYETIELPKLFDSLYSLSSEYSEKGGNLFLREIVNRFYDQPSAQKDVLNALRTLVIQEEFEFADKYLVALDRKDSAGWVEPTDLIAVGIVLSRQRNRDLRDPLLDRAVLTVREADFDKSINYVFLSYYEMNRAESLGRTSESLGLARELLRLLSLKKEPLASWAEGSRKAVQNAARLIVQRYEGGQTIRNQYNLGRNSVITVRYKDGRTVEKKFKFIQKDLALGLCEIIS